MRPFIFLTLVFQVLNIAGQGFPDNYHPAYHQFPDFEEGSDCIAKTVIFKLKPEYRDLLEEPGLFNGYIASLGGLVKRKFPNHRAPIQQVNEFGQELTDLSLIYELTYTADLAVSRVVAEISGSGKVLYAQPHFIDQPLSDPLGVLWVPNDPDIGLQWYLDNIRAIDAWDLDTGSASVVIAIVDGGTNFSHADLGQNVYYNIADPIDGIDNDGDGYVDNYRGWDVGDNDNDPQYTGAWNSAHGTAMCGLAAGSSNNGIGMAGVSYKCKYLPIKIVNAASGWIAGYDGIVYAADHGAHVISCSWGSQSPQPYAQDVVTYATVNQGKQIIAAAGNSNSTIPFYPASYEGVIACGGSDQLNVKSSNSSYYEFVDIVAPGQNIYETYATGYTYGNGTSDATAIASGGFGLLQSYFPAYHPHQVGALLTQTTYRIDTIPANTPYANRQGSGRIDLFNAMTAVQKPFIYMFNRTYGDSFDDIVLVGDTLLLKGNFINYLAGSTPDLKAILSSTSPHVQFLDTVSILGTVSTMGVLSNHNDGFSFVINPGCPSNHTLLLKVTYYDTDTLNTQYFTIVVNPQFHNLTMNGLHTTVTNTGRIGFFNNNTTLGVGYRMNGGPNQLLVTYYNPMGFWVGHNSWVSNQTIRTPVGPCCPLANDNHFLQVSPISRVIPPEVADIELVSHYNDAGAGLDALNIEVLQKSYAWSGSPADSNFIILEYQLLNNGPLGLSDVFAGIFSDFDVLDSLFFTGPNQAQYHGGQRTGMIRNPGGSVVTGIKVISGQQVQYYGFNSDGSGGSYLLYDGLSQPEKWGSMSGGIQLPQTLITDIAQYIGVKVDSIPPGGCATVVMALLIATDTTALLQHANAAQLRYDNMYNTWHGQGGDTDWHNPLNWSKGTVPGFNDYVIIPDTRGGSQLDPVISSADAQVKNIEIRCGGDLRLINNRKLQVGN